LTLTAPRRLMMPAPTRASALSSLTESNISSAGLRFTPAGSYFDVSHSILYDAFQVERAYPKYTVERNKTYRLRLVNSGSFPAIRFSVDNHPLTLIEADSTLFAPTRVFGVILTAAQRIPCYCMPIRRVQTGHSGCMPRSRATCCSTISWGRMSTSEA
jgi:Multicopper oxidase